MKIARFVLFLFLCSTSSSLFAQKVKKQDYLVSFADTVTDTYGYKNQLGDTVIKAGKYSICFTDTFKTFAIVLKPGFGFVAIDRHENVLYEVFPFDNGPDYEMEGLFRIVKDKKIGYASAKTGKIIIQPKFMCANPFENGLAVVSFNCTTKHKGEHSWWLSDSWVYINRKGLKINKKVPD